MNPARLRQLRRARGLSLDALASEIDNVVSKQTLSKYEQGKTKPGPDVLAALAAALGVDVNQLESDSSVDVRFIAYRKGSGLSRKSQLQIEEKVRSNLEKRVELSDIIGANSCDVPLQKFQVRKLADIEKMAEKLRDTWDIGRDAIANVTLLLEDHLVHVIEIEADKNFDGLSAIAYRDDQNIAATATITRSGLPGERQRLNLAHELGHQILKIPKHVDEEEAAFRFAGALLAPESLIKKDIGNRRTSIKADELLLLKDRYGISIQALLVRLRNLSIINESHYRHWFREIGRLGWRKREPNPIEPERPQWLKLSVMRAVSEGSMTENEAEQFRYYF